MEKEQLAQTIDRYIKVSFQVNNAAESLIKKQISEYLTSDQYYMLRYIQQRKSCTSTDLAEAFYVNKSAITAITTRLNDKGLIKRSRDENDRRVVYLTLTNEGANSCKETEVKVHKLVESFITRFDDEEIQSFMDTYEKLSEILIEMKQEEQEARE